jgi:hemolysin activation/secretion protein
MMKLSNYLFSLSLLATPMLANANGFGPDAGSMLSNTQQMMSAREAPAIEAYPIEYYPRLRWTDEFSMKVNSIAIQGNSLVPTDKLQVAVKGYVGKRLMVEKLSTVSAAVTKAYRDAGYRVRAYIPDQSFANGRLVVQVIETNGPR